jgi:RNase adaptor protein for sRNA GlmZ degradation
MDIGETIRTQVRKAVEQAARDGRANVASAVNVGGAGHHTSVYSDDQVTVIERDGETQVIQHDQEGRKQG